MAILRRAFPETSVKIKDLADIVGFRNFLVHQYLDLDNDQVWGIVRTRIAPLKESVARLIEEFDAQG